MISTHNHPPSEAAEVRTPCRSGVRTGSTDSGKLKTERKEAGPASKLTSVTGWTKTVGNHITPHFRNVWMTKWPRKTMLLTIKSHQIHSFSNYVDIAGCVHENQQNIPRWVVLCSWPKTQCHPRAGHRLQFHVSLKIVWRTTSNYSKESIYEGISSISWVCGIRYKNIY